MNDAPEMEEIHLLKRVPPVLQALWIVHKSLVSSSVLSTVVTNSLSFFGGSSIRAAWTAGAVCGFLAGPFLDFGELHSLRQLIHQMDRPELQYPAATIRVPDQAGGITLRFVSPYKTIRIEGARRVFVVRQNFTQYFAERGHLKVALYFCFLLSIDAGLAWSSIASLLQRTKGLLSASAEVWALLLGPFVGFGLATLGTLLARKGGTSKVGTDNA
jgi:hypothetical protein